MKVVILAGGKGKRLWPVSKNSCPKQFLTFFDEKSLLQKTIDRFDSASFVDHIVISGNKEYKPILEKHIEQKNKPISIIYEPISKNTAPAIVLATKFLEETHAISPEEKILVIPSDHYLESKETFLNSIEKAQRQNDAIVTFGIKPTRAETGYGYICIDQLPNSPRKIKKFIEKPPMRVAKQIYKDPTYFWNAGIFLFSKDVLWKECKKHCHDLYKLAGKGYDFLLENFSKCPNISFDHAIMEKTSEGYCFPLKIQWSDIGSWDSVYDILCKDKNKNVKIGNVVDLDTKNSLIIGHKKMISMVGLKDIIFIETDEEIFLAKKGKSQDVKRLLDLIYLKKQS